MTVRSTQSREQTRLKLPDNQPDLVQFSVVQLSVMQFCVVQLVLCNACYVEIHKSISGR